MKGLSETQRGILLSSMSDASCAMTLGRSDGWVKARRAEIAAEGKATETVQARCGQVIDPAELDEIETSGEGDRQIGPPPAGAAAVVSSEPSPLPTPPEATAAPRARRSPRQARSPKPEARSPKPEARSPGVRPCVTRVKRVSPAIVRWAGWFLDARWPLPTVADLFDVDAEQLLTALDPA